jgi:hypothetical protein
MESIAFLLGLVGTGALTKVGENLLDKFLSLLQRKVPNTKTVKALEAGEAVDMPQAVIDLKPIAANLDDPEIKQLLEEVRSLLILCLLISIIY